MLLLATQALPQMREYAHPNLGRLLTPRHVSRIADTLAEGWPVACDNDCFNGYAPAAIAKLFAKLHPGPLAARPLATRHTRSCGSMPTEGSPGRDGASSATGFSRRPMQLPAIPQNLLWVAVPDVVSCACGAEEHLPKEHRGRAAPRSATHRRRWSVSALATLDLAPAARVRAAGRQRAARHDPLGRRPCRSLCGGSDELKLGPTQPPRSSARRASRGLYAHMGRVNSEKRIQYAKSIGCTSVDGTGWTTWRRANLPRGLHAVEHARQRPVHWQTRLPL